MDLENPSKFKVHLKGHQTTFLKRWQYKVWRERPGPVPNPGSLARGSKNQVVKFQSQQVIKLFWPCVTTVVWSILRLLTIDERVPLRAVNDDKWPSQFKSYLEKLHCPLPSSSSHSATISWLLGVAVRLEYGESPEKFNRIENVCDFNGKTGTSLSGPEYESGVAALAEILKVLFGRIFVLISTTFYNGFPCTFAHVVLYCRRTGTLSSWS